MKKALIGLFILWGLSWLWYQGYREGWRQASEASAAETVSTPCIQEQTYHSSEPQPEVHDLLHPPSGVVLTSL